MRINIENLWYYFKIYRGYPVRNLRTKIFDYKFKLVARFITKHALWWNEHDAKRWSKFI